VTDIITSILVSPTGWAETDIITSILVSPTGWAETDIITSILVSPTGWAETDIITSILVSPTGWAETDIITSILVSPTGWAETDIITNISQFIDTNNIIPWDQRKKVKLPINVYTVKPALMTTFINNNLYHVTLILISLNSAFHIN
jgi:predicted HAD superfamily Cof-like phosphohydrolase